MSLPARRVSAILIALSLAAVSTTAAIAPAQSAGPSTPDPAFTRIDVDNWIVGASFSSVGELVPGEQAIVTSSYGTLDTQGKPNRGGGLQIYRPGASLTAWTKVTVFNHTANIYFPNQTTIVDMDGDGDNDLLVPSGNFFETDPAGTVRNRGAITWFENQGVTEGGALAPFVRHNILTAQPWAYHGVQYVDLDGDGVRDILTVGEQGKAAGDPADDALQMQFLKGVAGSTPTFQSPVALSTVGGSLPIVHDVDDDGDLDIISSQYFDLITRTGAASFLWLERVHDDAVLSADDFVTHTIATALPTDADRGLGMGFQIRPVPGFREPGKVAWVGTNHNNRCTHTSLPPEQVVEFTPKADITEQWSLNTLSNTATTPATCPNDYFTDNYPVLGDAITSRYGYGQGAPGVFGYGDIDGDGDVDLLVSGDGDRRLWWIENEADGSTTLHQLTAPGEYFGQAGGAVVADFNHDGRNELVFSSFDRNTLAIWTRVVPTVPQDPQVPVVPVVPVVPPVATVTVPSSVRVGPETRTVKAGKKATWSVRFTGAPGGARRTVSVLFDPAKGKSVKVGTVQLAATNADGAQQGSFAFKAKAKGRFIVSYAGTSVSPTLRDTSATDSARVLIRRR